MKKLAFIQSQDQGHWVGDGFPVRSVITYHERSGFETVTIIYSGEVAHRDSTVQVKGVRVV